MYSRPVSQVREEVLLAVAGDSGRLRPLLGNGGRSVRARVRGRGVRRLSLDAGEPALSWRAICAAVGARLPAATAARGAVGGVPEGDRL